MTAFQGAFEKAGIVDVALGLCATDEERLANTLRVFTILNRHGPQFQHIRGRVDPARYKIELLELIPYRPSAEKGSEAGRSGSPGRRRRSWREDDPSGLEDRDRV